MNSLFLFSLLLLLSTFSISTPLRSTTILTDEAVLSDTKIENDDEGTDHDLQIVERPFIYETKSNIDTSSIKNILVLGAGGLIGRNLVNMLKTKGYSVYEVKNRRHIDLRVPKILDQFDNIEIDFVFFLACEVGGSKFLDDSNLTIQQQIIENNLKIYQVVFPYLARRKIPFLFTSSYLQAQPTAYGAVKRLGERWVEALQFGRSVRLWNVYGIEPTGLRSHVITDWVSQCLFGDREIKALTDGTEARQFLHVSDCAAAFIKMMTIWPTLPPSTDLSSGIWTKLIDLAEIISASSPEPCKINFANTKAIARARLLPKLVLKFHQEWKPLLEMSEGVKLVVSQCLDQGITVDDRDKETYSDKDKDL